VLNKLLNILKGEADLLEENVEEAPNEAESLASKDHERNTRVVPKKSRLNSSGEEVYDVDEEENNPNAQGKSVLR
jgi:hypothetical protein